MSNFFTLDFVLQILNVLILNNIDGLACFWHVILQKQFLFMKKIFAIITLSFSLTWAQAQTMTMDECMEYALEHSVLVSKQQNYLDNAEMGYKQSIAAFFPSVSGGVSGSMNFGRSIDPASNGYTNVSTFSNSYSLSASMPLFAGLRYVNNMRAAKVARERGVHDLQVVRDNVALEVMKAYINVIYYKGAVEIAEEHLNSSRQVLFQTEKLHEVGRKSAAEVAEIAAQEANYDYLLAEQQNNLAMAWINLRNVMNFPQDAPLEVTDSLGVVREASVEDVGCVVSFALANNPRIVSAALSVRESKLQYAKAKAVWFPAISLQTGISTSYFVNMDSPASYSSFASQFNNNRGSYVGVSMSIPIFSNLDRKATVRSARNALRNAELENTALRATVESEVLKACRQKEGYRKLCLQAEKKVAASQIAYEGVVAKFEKGLVTAIDLQTASTTLLQARSEFLHSRLQYVIESRMVDYYNGLSLVTLENK